MKRNKKVEKFDFLLKKCLRTEQKPGDLLHQQIMKAWKEPDEREHAGTVKAWKIVAAVVAIVVMVSSVSAYAASKLLNASRAAKALGKENVSELFEGDDAVYINETQETGGYLYTLLGIAEGEKLMYIPGSVDSDSFYVVLAVSRADGGTLSLEEYGKENNISMNLMIQGFDPGQLEYYMGMSYTGMEVDGTLYYLMASDKISYFADRELYLGICDSMALEEGAYLYDENTGIITSNKEYEGMNLLFRLPIDESKADPQRAQEYLEKLHQKEEKDSKKEKSMIDAFANQPTAKKDYLTIEKVLEENSEEIDSVFDDLGAKVVSSQTVEETDGKYKFEVAATGFGKSQITCKREEFEEDGIVSTVSSTWGGKEGVVLWIIVKLNPDDTATCIGYCKEYYR